MAVNGDRTTNDDTIPYWNVNIPKEQWTMGCPEALQDLTESDEKHLSMLDEDYHQMTWEDVRQVISANRLEAFKRLPSDLRRYRAFIYQIKQSYGSVLNFILKKRLVWTDVKPEAAPFQHADDVRILYNDWPYGIDSKIVHLVVWVKFQLEVDPSSAAGDLTPKARKEIEDYVEATFCQHMNPNDIIWFKNWAALKSVHAVEHFHVMLYDPDPAFVHRITNDDVAVSAMADGELLT